MGQSASKLIQRAVQRGATAAPRAPTTTVTQPPHHHHHHAKDLAQQAFWQQQRQQQRAGRVSGMDPGTSSSSTSTSAPDPTHSSDSVPELHPDLIQFLQMVGPVKKRVVSSRYAATSPLDQSDTAATSTTTTTTTTTTIAADPSQGRSARMPRWMKTTATTDDDPPNDPTKQPSSSSSSSSSPFQHESMPLAAALPDYRVERSTSFSKDDTETDPWQAHEFGLDVVDLYQLIMQQRQRQGKGGKGKGEGQQQGENYDDVVSDFYRRYLQKRREAQEDRPEQGTNHHHNDTTTSSSSSGWSEWTQAEQEEHQRLLRQTLAYVQVPVLFQDIEDDSWLVGAWPPSVSSLSSDNDHDPTSHSSHLRFVPPSTLKWVVQDLAEWEQSREAIVVESSSPSPSRATTTTTTTTTTTSA